MKSYQLLLSDTNSSTSAVLPDERCSQRPVQMTAQQQQGGVISVSTRRAEQMIARATLARQYRPPSQPASSQPRDERRSSTSSSKPGLDHHALQQLDLSALVDKLSVSFLQLKPFYSINSWFSTTQASLSIEFIVSYHSNPSIHRINSFLSLRLRLQTLYYTSYWFSTTQTSLTNSVILYCQR